MISQNTAKKVSLVLGVASVAVNAGNVAVKAGPALQTLNNLTNTAEFTINNTYGQSFSVDGVVTAAVTPFAAAATLSPFNAATATLTTGFTGTGMGESLKVVQTVQAQATIATPVTAVLILSTAIGAISILGSTGTQTIGASISSTLFGPSNVRASSSFTNQLINDLSAF